MTIFNFSLIDYQTKAIYWLAMIIFIDQGIEAGVCPDLTPNDGRDVSVGCVTKMYEDHSNQWVQFNRKTPV